MRQISLGQGPVGPIRSLAYVCQCRRDRLQGLVRDIFQATIF